jgi:hypothetical protein
MTSRPTRVEQLLSEHQSTQPDDAPSPLNASQSSTNSSSQQSLQSQPGMRQPLPTFSSADTEAEASQPPTDHLLRRRTTVYAGAVQSICSQNTDRVNILLDFDQLRWDTGTVKGQNRVLDEERVAQLEVDILTENQITEPIKVVVWPERSMYLARMSALPCFFFAPRTCPNLPALSSR